MVPQLVLNGLSNSLLWQCFLVCAVTVAVYLIWTLYRYERRLVARSVGDMLLVLRILVIVCLCLTFLEPTLFWSQELKRNGKILVAIDVSESMTTADTHALPGEKLRWARALGMVGGKAGADRIPAWQNAYDNHQEPEWVLANETADPDRSRRLASLRKLNLEKAMEEAAKLSRKEIARRLLTLTTPPLLPALEKLGRVQIVAFGGKPFTTDASQLPQVVTTPAPGIQTHSSDLSAALAQAIPAGEEESVVGVVLLTDGRDNSGHDPGGMASRLGNMQAPVFPVLIGSRLRPKDLAVAGLDYPQTVFKDDKPILKVMLNTAGFEGQSIQVKLASPDGENVEKSLIPAGPQTEVEFPLAVNRLGRFEYTVSAPAMPAETRIDNNSRSFSLTAVDDKVHVLMLDGEARWEFRYIDNALKRDLRVDLSSVVFEQPYLGILEDTFFPRQINWPADVNSLAQSPLANIDLVILGDISASHLPPHAWVLLEKWVSEAGGTLVFSAGKRHFQSLATIPVIQQLMPITLPLAFVPRDDQMQGGPLERGFRLKLTPEAEVEAMFQFDTDSAVNRTIWSNLPGHLWGIVGQAKPGTTVLAAPYFMQADLNLEAARRNALFVQQFYGQGQTLWLGIDSTWRWRHLVGDTYHHRFWGQLGRWAARNKTVAGNAFVKFGPDRPELMIGESVLFRARWTPEFLKRFPQLKARVELFPTRGASGKPFSVLNLKPDPSRPLVHETPSATLPAGNYQARLRVDDAEFGNKDVVADVFVQQPPSAELMDLSANRELMVQLAQLSGGQLVLPEDAHTIPDLLKGPTAMRIQRQDEQLWNHPLMMIVFCILLMAEWVIRKLHGLP